MRRWKMQAGRVNRQAVRMQGPQNRRRPNTVWVYVANITSWGDKAKKFVDERLLKLTGAEAGDGNGQEVVAACFQETHKDKEEANKPEEGKTYALTGGRGTRCIANGNTWKESEVKDD